MSNENQQSSTTFDAQQIEQARKEVNRISEEIAQLADSEMQPPQFYSEFLQRVYFAMQGFGAAIWIRTPQGNLQQQCQINLREVGLDRTPESRPMHDELLRQSAMQAKGGIVNPNFSHNFGTGSDQIAGNPTDFIILLAPILQEKQVIGLVEIWQDPTRAASIVQNLYQFLVRMAAFISVYQRNNQLRTMLGQQDLWLKLEAFARQIHGSLHTTEVAYLVANEARRLIEADRVSVATRPGSGCVVTAISGADVVEKRSNLVQLMRHLFDAVIDWGERLIYTGTKDDALPPKVLDALDAYLGESNSKILVIMPLVDEREKELKKKPRSALMMECFETNLQPEQLLARLDVVGKHACTALYNAQDYRRIPMRFLWLPLAHVQDGLGGKTKAIIASSVGGVVALLLLMIFCPFPLKMEANGQVLPKVRQWVYPPIPGHIDDIPTGLASGSKIYKGQPLFYMYDTDLAKNISDVKLEIKAAEAKMTPMVRGSEDKNYDAGSAREAEIQFKGKSDYLQQLRRRLNADLSKPGHYLIATPKTGIILSSDFRESLLGRNVKPGDPLVRVGYSDVVNPKLSDWEIELKIPQKHYGQVLKAFEAKKAAKQPEELDVDVLFTSEATRSFRAKLRRDKVASQANTQKDDNNESEPVVLAWARINPINGDISESERIPTRLLLSNGEVHTRIRCGTRAMGYSLFYGVYEWSYEKIIFPYFQW